MKKKELLKELKSSKKLYAYITYNDGNGGYFQMVKSDFIESVSKMDDNKEFYNVSVTASTIYIG
jgi:hypothetical protein